MTATFTQAGARIDARTAAYLIANRLAQAGYTEDGVIPAMAAEHLPGLEVLIDGRRFLVTVEPVPERYQPKMDPADRQWLLTSQGGYSTADGAVQEVLF